MYRIDVTLGLILSQKRGEDPKMMCPGKHHYMSIRLLFLLTLASLSGCSVFDQDIINGLPDDSAASKDGSRAGGGGTDEDSATPEDSGTEEDSAMPEATDACRHSPLCA